MATRVLTWVFVCALAGCGLAEKFERMQKVQEEISAEIHEKAAPGAKVAVSEQWNNGTHSVVITVTVKEAPEKPEALKLEIADLVKPHFDDVDEIDVKLVY